LPGAGEQITTKKTRLRECVIDYEQAEMKSLDLAIRLVVDVAM